MNYQDLQGLAFEREHKMQMHEMATQERVANIFSFIDSLDAEQLRSLQYMLDSIDGPDMTMFYFGCVSGILSSKHGAMSFDDSMDKMSGAVDVKEDPQGGTGNSDCKFGKDGLQRNLHGEYDARQLDRYSLVAELDGVSCSNCGMRYSSLADRARREPGTSGCQGCRQKEMWG